MEAMTVRARLSGWSGVKVPNMAQRDYMRSQDADVPSVASAEGSRSGRRGRGCVSSLEPKRLIRRRLGIVP